ncbi:MAG: hypothetical protein HKUEN01_16690 [Candidatus Kuenenia stuttgartiensis]|nr:MAG: hypothetical protein HKUEN01_16690 [Candidatus Kuenenia stuttgartiensis]
MIYRQCSTSSTRTNKVCPCVIIQLKHGLAKSPDEWPYFCFHCYVKQGAYASDWRAGNEIKFNVKVGHE